MKVRHYILPLRHLSNHASSTQLVINNFKFPPHSAAFVTTADEFFKARWWEMSWGCSLSPGKGDLEWETHPWAVTWLSQGPSNHSQTNFTPTCCVTVRLPFKTRGTDRKQEELASGVGSLCRRESLPLQQSKGPGTRCTWDPLVSF